MGIIRGFLGGAGKGMADVSTMMFQQKLQSERDEANFLRDRELRREGYEHDENMADQKIKADIFNREDQQAFDASQLDKKINAENANAKAGDKISPEARKAAELMAEGYPKDIANGVAYGSIKEVKDDLTGDMSLVNTLTNQPVGRMTTSGKNKIWLPEGEKTPNADIEKRHRDMADKAYDEQASMWRSDQSQFGMPEKDWKKKQAQEAANKERESNASMPGGINAVKNEGKAPEPAKKTAPKAALDYLEKNKNDPKIVKMFEEKYGYNPYK